MECGHQYLVRAWTTRACVHHRRHASVGVNQPPATQGSRVGVTRASVAAHRVSFPDFFNNHDAEVP
eukprot:CAMPEP_0119219316 /NCGR_PEP_ID=MMETSP1327-20130426/23218_1 /TAXON_ID=38833 /ORGANISM="Micromonas pusilla, Strain RCC2306" /LENGTH=65 /DNA_ID=CAMNT_0007217375 /DNA_START=66 /DNA_END=260 /DNA_ORIENTATION=-